MYSYILNVLLYLFLFFSPFLSNSLLFFFLRVPAICRTISLICTPHTSHYVLYTLLTTQQYMTWQHGSWVRFQSQPKRVHRSGTYARTQQSLQSAHMESQDDIAQLEAEITAPFSDSVWLRTPSPINISIQPLIIIAAKEWTPTAKTIFFTTLILDCPWSSLLLWFFLTFLLTQYCLTTCRSQSNILICTTLHCIILSYAYMYVPFRWRNVCPTLE